MLCVYDVTIDNVLNNGTHVNSAESPSKTEVISTEPISDRSSPDKSKHVTSIEMTSKDTDEADNSTNTALNDSVMAVYGGKDETFMENSTLEQSVDMANDQTNDTVCNSSAITGTLEDTEKSSTQENTAVKSDGNEETPEEETPGQDGTNAIAQKVLSSNTPTENSETDREQNTSAESKDETTAPAQVEEVKMEECEGGQENKSPSKGGKQERGSKRHRDR